MVGSGDDMVYILSAANGIGKTAVLVNIAASIIWGPQNKFFDYEIFRNWPYEKRLRFVSEPSQVKASGPFPTEIAKWWRKGQYTEYKDGQHYTSIYVAGDFILEVMTYEQMPKQHEGANLGAVFFNEPPPRDLWTPNISRLRNGGFAAIGMTPLTSASWVFDELVPRHASSVVYADIETACKEHGKNGHLDHANIEKTIAEYDPEEREARIEGKAMYLKGKIFKTFDPAVHVLKEAPKVPQGAQVYQFVDPHDDKPFACIWVMPDAIGDLYIIDEWPNEDFYRMHNCQLTVKDYANIFRDKEQKWKIEKRIIDRHFAERSAVANRKTLREEFQDETGLYFEPSYASEREIETGILKVREYMKYDSTKEFNALNKPKLFISPVCTNTIKSLTRWARDPETGKVQEGYKDFCDVVRYMAMEDPKISQPLPEFTPRKSYG